MVRHEIKHGGHVESIYFHKKNKEQIADIYHSTVRFFFNIIITVNYFYLFQKIMFHFWKIKLKRTNNKHQSEIKRNKQQHEFQNIVIFELFNFIIKQLSCYSWGWWRS